MKCNQVGYKTVTAITRKDLFSNLQKKKYFVYHDLILYAGCACPF